MEILSFWNTFMGQICIELMGGVVGSFIFLFIVLFLMRPSISISAVIAKQENTFDAYFQHTYVFKIINRSWFDAFEIQLELFEVSFYPGIPDGVHKRFTEIPLKRNQLKQIPAKHRMRKHSQLANHCVCFRTNSDLLSVLRVEEKGLQLQVTLKHGLTGLAKVYKMDYRSVNSVKNGNFVFGNSFDVT